MIFLILFAEEYMYLTLAFKTNAKGYELELAHAEVYVPHDEIAYKLQEVPLEDACEKMEFNLVTPSGLVRREGDLSTDFARESLSSTSNASYRHRLILEDPESESPVISLRDYIEYFAHELSSETDVPVERMRIDVETRPLNGSFKACLIRDADKFIERPKFG